MEGNGFLLLQIQLIHLNKAHTHLFTCTHICVSMHVHVRLCVCVYPPIPKTVSSMYERQFGILKKSNYYRIR